MPAGQYKRSRRGRNSRQLRAGPHRGLGRSALLGDLDPDTDLAAFGLFSEANAAGNIAMDLSKMKSYGLYTQDPLGELFVQPLISVDHATGMVSVRIQLERAETLSGVFSPVDNPFLYREPAGEKALFLLRSGPGQE